MLLLFLMFLMFLVLLLPFLALLQRLYFLPYLLHLEWILVHLAPCLLFLLLYVHQRVLHHLHKCLVLRRRIRRPPDHRHYLESAFLFLADLLDLLAQQVVFRALGEVVLVLGRPGLVHPLEALGVGGGDGVVGGLELAHFLDVALFLELLEVVLVAALFVFLLLLGGPDDFNVLEGGGVPGLLGQVTQSHSDNDDN